MDRSYFYKAAATVAALVSFNAHAGDYDNDYIIRGTTVTEADPIAATTVAVLNEDRGGVALCTGSIVAPDLVVTAGHCVGPDASRMRVIFKTDLSTPDVGRVALVTGYERPEAFGRMVLGEDMDDIALIRFEGGLPPKYHAAKLLTDAGALKVGVEVILAGYGVKDGVLHETGKDVGAGILRKVEVKIEKFPYGKTEILMDQSHGKGACHGDSGGPAFLKQGGELLLFGVTSRGVAGSADDCSSAAVYSNILAHGKFLKEAAAKLRK